MRITPNHPRLRLVALGCWAVSGWCIIQGGRLASGHPGLSLMIVGVEVLGLLLLAIGIAFWQMSVDTRAGIVFDAKGLLLNLGHSSAVIAWENIERVGGSGYRASVLALGSRQQLGIRLRDVRAQVRPDLEKKIKALGGIVVSTSSTYDSIVGWVPLQTLERLATDPGVRAIEPAAQ